MKINDHIAEIREEFPALKKKTYLNSAAHGPALKRVYDAMQKCWTHRFNEDRVEPPDAKPEAARLINADPDEICWVNRVSQGLNTVAGMMKPERGQNIVVTDLAYPSNVVVWFPYRESGVEVRYVRHRDGVITLEDFEKAIDDNTRAICSLHYSDGEAVLGHGLVVVFDIGWPDAQED